MRKQSFVMSIEPNGDRRYSARHEQEIKESVSVENTIGRTFRAGCCVPLRLIFIKTIVVGSILTLVIPLLFAIFYCLYAIFYCMLGGKLKDIKNRAEANIGLLFQPVILEKKAKKGTPRYNQIQCTAPFKLFLGAQPDLYGGFHDLFRSNDIRTVVSLNSDKERSGNCWARPPSDSHYLKHNVVRRLICTGFVQTRIISHYCCCADHQNFVKITLNDHSPLTVAMLATSADSIHEGLQVGDVYVHCKAGQGRSAQSILAYLMKHEQESVDQAITHMQRDRPNITLITTAQVQLLKKPKKRAKHEERHNFFQSFLRQHCDELTPDNSALAFAGNPLTKRMRDAVV